jgi:NADPH:quinone reductase-like Zn-dependent oxidoreductase
MKAVVYEKYGSPEVLEYKEIEKPTVLDDDVLVKINAAAMNPLDWRLRSGTPFLARLIISGIMKPKMQILGVDFAGTVESVGKNVEQLKIGDEVFGMAPSGRNGSHAEYISVSEENVALKPANTTYEQAAGVPFAGTMALEGVRDYGEIKPGQRFLINGASGGMGTYAVQIAKAFGAEVTGVCSTRNLEMVQSIGADHVIDYTKEDFTKNGKIYNVIFDVVAKNSFSNCSNSLSDNGIYITTGMGPGLIFQKFWTSMTSSKKMLPMWGKGRKEDLIILKDLIEDGSVTTVIDRTYSLNEVPEAHRYIEQGHARGKVIIKIA